jgi:hypothetical protein
MDKQQSEQKTQLIVNDGILYNKRDMMMLLKDLANVEYSEIIKNKIVGQGKGYVMRVALNSEEPTLFLGGRIYINVGAFDYLHLKKIKGKENTVFELHRSDRVMRLIPEENPFPPLDPKTAFTERIQELTASNPEEFDFPGNVADRFFDN